jgi:hypothetical protein
MKKRILQNNAYYSIMWSPLYPYDRHAAARVLPELSGIICLMEDVPGGEPQYLMFYGCWRVGVRYGLKILFDPDFSKYPEIRDSIKERKLLYKYTIVDSNPVDMKDIMYLLIRNYSPEFNDFMSFRDSDRYENIYIRELVMKKGETIERFPRSIPY